MRIAFISQQGISDHNLWGGINTHAKMLSGLLLKQGHFVTFFTSPESNKNKQQNPDTLELVYIDSPALKRNGKWAFRLCATFLDIHNNTPFDCIFAEGASAWGLRPLFPALKLPVFAFVHNFGIVHFYNTWKEVYNVRSMLSYFSKTIPRIFRRTLLYDVPFLQNSRWVISGSQFNAALLRRFYRIPRSKLRVIHNWINPNHFTPIPSLRNETRSRLSIPQDALTFLLVGSLWRPKGFQIAIKSFNDLLHLYPHAHLLIVGTGPLEGSLKNQAQRNIRLKRRVRFLGNFSNSKLPSIYNSADIFLNPSLISEVLPYVLIEAMSCGLPIIATKLSGNSEAVGKTGLLVPPGDSKSLTDAMLFLAKHPQKRKTFSTLARKRAIALFSEEVAEKRISSLFDLTFGTGQSSLENVEKRNQVH